VTERDRARERDLADPVHEVKVLRAEIDPRHPHGTAVQAYAAAMSRVLVANPSPDLLKSLGFLGASVGVVIPDWEGEEAKAIADALKRGDCERLKAQLLAPDAS
jgi:hypothetical protein